MSKGGGQTIGYHYLFSILFGIGRGPLNEVIAIKAADKIVWEGHACDQAVWPIDKPELFGGESKEGGIQGLFRVFHGAPDQVLPGASGTIAVGSKGPYKSGNLPDVKAAMGGDVSELRGRAMVWFDGLIASMNPYIKEWKFRVRRTHAGWDRDEPWYPAKSTIYLKDGYIHAMNPAHIIYECCTNRAWGRGLPTTRMGDTFVYAANLFCEEFLGLCLAWMRRDGIDEFVKRVCDHTGCVVYTDRETGLIEIKVLRADYDSDDIPHFTVDSGLLRLTEDDSGSSDGIADEIVVTGHDPITDQKIEGRAHNPAVRQSREGTSAITREYEGLPTTDLCNRVAARDMAVGAGGLRKFTVILDRAGFKLHPGAVFKVTYAPRGITALVLRAGEIDDGDMLNGQITIRAVQDIFALPSTTWITPTENEWTPPTDEAIEATDQELFELSYRDIYKQAGQASAESVQAEQTYLGSLAGRPVVTNVQYALLARPAGDPSFERNGAFYFTANAVLVGALTPTATSFVISSPEDFPDADDLVGDSLLIGAERMLIEDYDEGTLAFTVKRGVMDTWPAAHLAGTRVWFPDDDIGADSRVFAPGESIEGKILTRSTSAELAEADADLLTIDLIGRAFRPYPPADVKVNGVSIYGSPQIEDDNEPEITWVERNRLTQADALVGFFEPTVAAEAGTTYRLRIFLAETGGVAVNEYGGIASGWNYLAADQIIDGTDDMGGAWGELVAVRDGEESYPQRRFYIVLRTGYGYGYGFNYGGLP